MLKGISLLIGLALALAIPAARAQNVIPHNEIVTATSPLPSGSCFYVDQGPGTNAKLCTGYAGYFSALAIANNLSDVANVATARTNLGLGTSSVVTFGGLSAIANLGGSGVRCLHVDNTGTPSLASGDCATGGSGSVTSIAQGTGMSFSVTPITTSGTINLANTAVTPGVYTNLNATIDAQGRITAAANGSLGNGTVASSTIGQIPVYTAATTVTGTPNITFTSGLLKLDTNASQALPTFGAGQPLFMMVAPDATSTRFGALSFGAANGSGMIIAAAGGTAGSPTALGSGLAIGTHAWDTYDGTSINNVASVRGSTTEVQTPTAHGSQVAIRTTANGTTTPIDGIIVGQDQSLTVANQAGSGFGCVHADATGKQSRSGSDCALAAAAGNTVIANVTNSPAVPTAASLPTCPDSGGNHYNYTPGTGFTCGTSASGGYVPPGRRIVSGGTDTATSGDYTGSIFWASGTASGKTQNIPACGGGNNGQWIAIADEQGTAAAFNITITPASGTINAAASLALSTNKAAAVITCDGPSTNWVVRSSHSPPDIALDATTQTVTANQFLAGKLIVVTTPGQIITLPLATTLQTNSNIIIETQGPTATAILRPNAADGINGAAIGTDKLIPVDSTIIVTTRGISGSTAFTAPLPVVIPLPLLWSEGINLSTNARYISRVSFTRLVFGIHCNVQAAAGSASTIHIFATASGTAPNLGTQLDTTGCNANSVSNTEQDMGLSGASIPPNATVWAVFSGNGTAGNGGLTITMR